MATSYNLTFVIPNSSEFESTRQYLNFWQFSSGAGGYVGSGAQSLIESIMDEFVVTYGGSYTITSSDDGTNTTYAIAWVGLTTDPEDTASGEFVSLSIQDDGSTFFSAVFESVATATECESCYELSKASCEDSYVLSLDLTPATDYVLALYANNGNVYTQTCTANGSGELTIDATAPEFPEGFFIPESGGYVIKVFTDSDLTTVVPFIIGTNQYECIQLSFQYVTTTTSSIQAVFEYLIHDDDTDTDYFIIDDIGNNFIVG